MSQIEELIERLCPDGVPYETLRTVAQISGRNIQPSAMGDATVTVYSLPAFDNNRTAERLIGSDVGSAKTALAHPTVLVAKLNPHIPRVWKLASIPNNSYSSPEFFPLVPDPNRLDLGFLYYFISTQLGKLASTVTGSTNSHKRLHREDFLGLRIPVPPLEVQHEIVKILDTFTDLESELESELESRRLQYQLYQDKLLTPASDTTLSALGDISSIKTGGTVSKKFIRNNPGPFPVINSGKSPLGYVNAFNSEDDPIGITSRGAGVGSITWCPGRYFRGNLNYSVTIKSSKLVNMRFLYHSLVHLQPKIHELSTFQGIPALNKANLQKLRIPLPSLEQQERIVARLDTFDALVNDLNSGLPAELNGGVIASKQHSRSAGV